MGAADSQEEGSQAEEEQTMPRPGARKWTRFCIGEKIGAGTTLSVGGQEVASYEAELGFHWKGFQAAILF